MRRSLHRWLICVALALPCTGGCTTYTTSPPIVEKPTSLPPSAVADPTPSVATSSVPSPPSKPRCNPIAFVQADPGYTGTIESDNILGDLDGDGGIEHGVVVDINEGTWPLYELTIVSPKPDGSCVEVYRGSGSGIEVLEAKTGGWQDILLKIELWGPSVDYSGEATVYMTFAEGRYQWRQVMSCGVFLVREELSTAECRAVILDMAPKDR